MIISSIKIQNWRNFRQASASLQPVTYIIGANATGKSNLLDVFRFLRDIAKAQGGGLQAAIAERGGISKVRCLHSRGAPLEIEIETRDSFEAQSNGWRYALAIESTGVGEKQRPIIKTESVFRLENGSSRQLLARPDKTDLSDKARLGETSLEHTRSNGEFRDLAAFLAETSYLHLVPQLLKYGEKLGGSPWESDPFGQGFLARIAKTPEKTRNSRLIRIQKALSIAIPQFEEIKFVRDHVGHPHLEARYAHHRPRAGWQREDQFSDGTLRLIALFWMLMEGGDSLLLMEEPELSLDEDINRELPRLIHHVLKSGKKAARQIIISTHSQALLDNPAIDGRGVFRLERTKEGTIIHAPTASELDAMKTGLTPADVLLRQAHPVGLESLALV